MFVEQGGLILGHADCARLAFADSFKQARQGLFPAYEFRDLPATHVIYTNQQFKRSKLEHAPSSVTGPEQRRAAS